jgi:hypothetical protein
MMTIIHQSRMAAANLPRREAEWPGVYQTGARSSG